MSRLIGYGEDAALIAGGLDAPEAVSRRRAVAALLTGYQLYGTKQLDRGWRGCLRDALAELDPLALAHFDEHEDPALTRKLFCPTADDLANEDP